MPAANFFSSASSRCAARHARRLRRLHPLEAGLDAAARRAHLGRHLQLEPAERRERLVLVSWALALFAFAVRLGIA
jgi:hypothetical protein